MCCERKHALIYLFWDDFYSFGLQLLGCKAHTATKLDALFMFSYHRILSVLLSLDHPLLSPRFTSFMAISNSFSGSFKLVSCSPFILCRFIFDSFRFFNGKRSHPPFPLKHIFCSEILGARVCLFGWGASLISFNIWLWRIKVANFCNIRTQKHKFSEHNHLCCRWNDLTVKCATRKIKC